MSNELNSQGPLAINCINNPDAEFFATLSNKLKGRYLAFEGLDGSGKTTIQKWLASQLSNVTEVREPGSTKFGEDLRNILLKSEFKLDAFSELMLFMASRNELLHQVVVEALKHNVVLSDRCYISSYAYQAIHNQIPLKLFQEIVEHIYKDKKLDCVLYFKINYQEGLKRSAQVQEHDNMESKGNDFYALTQKGYEDYLEILKSNKSLLAANDFVELYQNANNSEALIIVDATQPLETVKGALLGALAQLS